LIDPFEQSDTNIALTHTLLLLPLSSHHVSHTYRQLHEDNDVTFAGYKIPHPLEYQMLVKVATNGRKSPQAAMQRAMERLKAEIRNIQLDFSNAAEKRERE
jgi:DNA-directed RNA polymerase II subunit RPB11